MTKHTCIRCGTCCRRVPGEAMPEDFGAPCKLTMIHRLRSAFLSGQWAIDWWDGDPREPAPPDQQSVSMAYFIRPAIIGWEQHLYHSTWGGQCAAVMPVATDEVGDG